jgi:hypothetical protein
MAAFAGSGDRRNEFYIATIHPDAHASGKRLPANCYVMLYLAGGFALQIFSDSILASMFYNARIRIFISTVIWLTRKGDCNEIQAISYSVCDCHFARRAGDGESRNGR